MSSTITDNTFTSLRKSMTDERSNRPAVVDLVLATRGRTSELEGFLGSLEDQVFRAFRLIVVDQNADDRLVPVLAGHPEIDQMHIRDRGGAGLSRARNRALEHLSAEIVGFPDDDCLYGPEAIDRVVSLFTTHPRWDGILGRVRDPTGTSRLRWSDEPGHVTRDTLWNCVSAAAIFLRRRVVEQVGLFDEELGLGSGTRWTSGEETDYVIRAIDAGFWLEFDPGLTVVHVDPFSMLDDTARRRAMAQGATSIRLMRKHGFPTAAIAKSVSRSGAGVAQRLAQGRLGDARFHAAVLRGRLSELARTNER